MRNTIARDFDPHTTPHMGPIDRQAASYAPRDGDAVVARRVVLGDLPGMMDEVQKRLDSLVGRAESLADFLSGAEPQGGCAQGVPSDEFNVVSAIEGRIHSVHSLLSTLDYHLDRAERGCRG